MIFKSPLLTLAGLLSCSLPIALEAAEDPAVSTFAPICRHHFVMRTPQGDETVFLQPTDDLHILSGPAPWVGETDGRQTLIRTEESYEGEARGYIFIDGWLRRELCGAKERVVRKGEGNTVRFETDGKWVTRRDMGSLKKLPDIWRDTGRWRLWFFNPNIAGAFFAEVSLFMLIASIPLLRKRRCLAAVCIIVSMGAFYGLLKTESRGAFVSILAGIVVWALCGWRKLVTKKVLMGLAICTAFIAVSVKATGLSDRFISNLVRTRGDKSNELRVEMMKLAPRMFAAAPDGWGVGEAGRAYVDWFQTGETFLQPDLISGHMTRLVELGWLSGSLYLFFWFFLFIGFLWLGFCGRSPLGCAVLTTFGFSGLFNSTPTHIELYIMPLLALGVTLRGCFWRIDWRRVFVTGGLSMVLVAVVLSGLLFIGRNPANPIRTGGIVAFNGRTPGTVIVDDGYAMNGGCWWVEGREVREWFATRPNVSCGYTRSLSAVRRDVTRLVLIGEAGSQYLQQWEKLPHPKELIFLSPSFELSRIPSKLLAAVTVKAYRGDLMATVSERDLSWVEIVPGASLYLPRWLDYAVEK